MADNGYIYILVNSSLQKDYLKIGMTRREPDIRAKEISQSTGVAVDYLVAYEEEVPDCILTELLIHERLSQYRLRKNREFFVLPLKDAVRYVSEIASEIKKERKALISNSTDSEDKTEDNIQIIIKCLKIIQIEGGKSAYAIFLSDPFKNYYIQVHGGVESSLMYCDAVSNKFLSPDNALSKDKIEKLDSMGWNVTFSNSENYTLYNLWFNSENDEDRKDLAHKIMDTFIEIYNMNPNQRLETKLEFVTVSKTRSFFKNAVSYFLNLVRRNQ